MTAADAETQPVTIGPRVSSERVLSRIQQQIWTSQRLHRHAPLANMAKLHRIGGPLDPGRLVAAFDAVVRGSDALRSVVVDRVGDEPIIRVLAAPPGTTQVIDLPVDDVDDWATTRIATPVDPTVCAYDSVLLRHDDAHWTWWLDLHHLVIDAGGASEVFRATGEHYGELAGNLPLSDPGPSFYDYVDATAERFARGRPERTAHWAALTIDETPLAPFGPRAAATTCVERLPVAIDPRIEEALAGPYRTLSRELSLIGVLASALAVVLHRLDGRRTLTFGVPLHHRSGPIAPRVIGPLMELYPLTVEMGDDETFAELFGRVQRNLLDTMRQAKPGESPDLPFVGVLNVLTAQFGDFAGLPTVTDWWRSGHVDPAHPIRLHAYDYGDGLRAEVDLNDGLSEAGDHRALDHHLEAVVSAACADPDSSTGAVGLSDADDFAALAKLNPARERPESSSSRRPRVVVGGAGG